MNTQTALAFRPAQTTTHQTVVVAIGGNAILQAGQKGTIEEQIENVKACCDPIIDLAAADCNVVLTHGNGPQVGNLLLQNEAARAQVPQNPLDVCGAQTQGSLGYIISQCLQNRMGQRGVARPLATVLAQVVVDANDAAFQNPTKPIGPFYSEEEAKQLAAEKGFTMVPDSGRGWRRVVPSPLPVELVESAGVKTLSDAGFLVITVGGGGIPVVRDAAGALHGVEAVIDKDYASATVAGEIGADALLMLTGVEQVAVNFGTPQQKNLPEMTLAEARRYMDEGQFPPGSMGPKIEAAMRFVRQSGKTAIITSIERMKDALDGTTGTRIVP